jgi:hypothetical protein
MPGSLHLLMSTELSVVHTAELSVVHSNSIAGYFEIRGAQARGALQHDAHVQLLLVVDPNIQAISD